MRNLIFLITVLLLSCSGTETDNQIELHPSDSIETKYKSDDTCAEINFFEKEIRDGKLSKEKIISKLILFIPYLKNEYYRQGGKDYNTNNWVFPLQGYTSRNIGGNNGEGYVEGKYNFFDGNKHTGHPAHDIFINDANQDCLDDKTKEQVNVLSVSGGIVVAIEQEWDTSSNLRGGKYVWIYEPHTNSLYYYAHNDTVFVKTCDIVEPGDKISIVGRTGLNAYKKRSPTHLHFMLLTLKEDLTLVPVNPYENLIKAKLVE